MSGIFDLINSPIGKTVLQGLSKETNQPQEKTETVLQMAMPILLGAMKKNASSPDGAESLLNALNDSRHDGSILNDLSGFFQGGVNQNVKDDGAGILSHVLGSSQNKVADALSKNSGVDSQSVMRIMQIAAPVLLGYLGKQKRQNNINSKSDVENLLSSLMGGESSSSNLITKFLDQDGDGSVIDDVTGMIGNFFKKK